MWRYFCLQFFSWIIFPQSFSYDFSTILDFFLNEKIFGTERAPLPVSISAAGVNDTDGQFVTGDIDNNLSFVYLSEKQGQKSRDTVTA